MVHRKEQLTALILVGGYGKRLRPLTYTVPKPLIPFVNKPILEHQIEALVKNGVSIIILALNYYSDLIIQEVKNYKTKYNVDIIYSKEDEILGTGGPIALAKKYLKNNFYVLNSDVICNFPFKKMMEFHLKHKKEATILVTSVENPSRYGLVKTFNNSHLVQEFIEKPQNSNLNRINAGIYIFNESIFNRLEVRDCSLEREIFPLIVKEKLMVVYELKGFWMDIGQIKDYLKGQKMFLDGFVEKIKDYEKNVVLGKNVYIGVNTTIENSSIFDNVTIGDNVVIKDSIIGWNCIIKNNVKITNFSVLGNFAVINENVILQNALVEPNKIL